MTIQLRAFIVALLALVMLTSACGDVPTGPTPIVEDPNATVTYVVGTERVVRHPVTMSRTGGQFLGTNPNQPLTSGVVKVQGVSLTGEVDLYIFPLVTAGSSADTAGSRARCLTPRPGVSPDCSTAIAGPVRAVNGQSVELGSVSGLSFPSRHMVAFYLYGEEWVGGALYTTITGRKP